MTPQMGKSAEGIRALLFDGASSYAKISPGMRLRVRVVRVSLVWKAGCAWSQLRIDGGDLQFQGAFDVAEFENFRS